jgi:hypothetical protein
MTNFSMGFARRDDQKLEKLRDCSQFLILAMLCGENTDPTMQQPLSQITAVIVLFIMSMKPRNAEYLPWNCPQFRS